MRICCIRGTEASTLLQEEPFQRLWTALYERCPWATVFQSYEFVSRWYDVYQERFDPLILVKKSSDGRELQGLLTLAASRDSGQLVVAGAHQAEYHAWLALPDFGSSFIDQALDELVVNFPNQILTFRYLPPGIPREWINSSRRWGSHCVSDTYRRPLLDVSDGDKIKASLRKNHNKTALKYLSRMGEISFSRITRDDELGAVFDQIITNYDFRQGALSGVLPFQNDSLKKSFHLALLREPSILHVTAMKLGDTIVAANLGVHDTKTVHLGVFAYSPCYAKYSPGRLHLLLLGQDMSREGFSILDFTPGGDWKDRLCSHQDEVYMVKIFLGRRAMMKHKAIVSSQRLCKRVAQDLCINIGSVKRAVKKLCQIGATRSFGALVDQLSQNCRRFVSGTELRVYKFKPAELKEINPAQSLSRDSIRDLLKFRDREFLYTRQEFFSLALQWLEKGRHIYTRVEEGSLVHYGCLIERPEKIFLPEVQQQLKLSAESAVVLDFYTVPQARSRGLCETSLRQMAHDAMTEAGVKEILTFVMGGNPPFRRAIEKVGFRHEDTLSVQNAFRKLWRSSGTLHPTGSADTKHASK